MSEIIELKRSIETTTQTLVSWDHFTGLIEELKDARSAVKRGAPKEALEILDKLLSLR